MYRGAAAAALAAFLLPGAAASTLGESAAGEDAVIAKVEQHAGSALMRKEVGAEDTAASRRVRRSHTLEDDDGAEPNADLRAQLAAERDKTAALAKQMEEIKGMLQQALLTKKSGAQAPPGWSDVASAVDAASPEAPLPAAMSASAAIPAPVAAAAPTADRKSLPNPSLPQPTVADKAKAAKEAAAVQAMEKASADVEKVNAKLAEEVQWMPGKAKAAAMPVRVGPPTAAGGSPTADALQGGEFVSTGAETPCASELANFGCRCFSRDPGWDACDMYPCVDCTTKLTTEDMNLLPSDTMFLRLSNNAVEDFQPAVLERLPKLHGMLVENGVKIMGLNDRLSPNATQPSNQEFAALLQSLSFTDGEAE
eukprot:TRINITY_DN100868_c0_g1_i1.p1 TRINITY_DN100868_c0_g1~~TRINITY_DN100868_c0_g1_i1.p1  ORF type:complete len:367 (+),score=136.94 TRINITY_DN100868_c0_g1_i1:85-1185(+)